MVLCTKENDYTQWAIVKSHRGVAQFWYTAANYQGTQGGSINSSRNGPKLVPKPVFSVARQYPHAESFSHVLGYVAEASVQDIKNYMYATTEMTLMRFISY